MPRTFTQALVIALAVSLPLATSPTQAFDKLDDLAAASNDSRQASILCRSLQADPNVQLLDVLGRMKDRSPVVQNWLLSVAQSVADRNPQKSAEELLQFLPRLSEDPTARFWAFEFVTRDKPQLREKLLRSMLADPSLELRYEAVGLQMRELKGDASLSPEQRVLRYQELLAAARLPAQIQEIAKELKDLGTEINLLEHLGFLANWNICGIFNNVDGVGFDSNFPPEEAYLTGKLSLTSEYTGKDTSATWQTTSTEEADGAVNLNPIFNNAKGAIAYATSEFNAAGDTDCEIRIGSPNANKVWVNGELVIAREVYHTGSQIDQYTAPVTLKKGKNTILVKLCQNEQTDSWAQEWTFQLRFTDATGLAIQPAP